MSEVVPAHPATLVRSSEQGDRPPTARRPARSQVWTARRSADATSAVVPRGRTGRRPRRPRARHRGRSRPSASAHSQREERVLVAPDELDGDVDPRVQRRRGRGRAAGRSCAAAARRRHDAAASWWSGRRKNSSNSPSSSDAVGERAAEHERRLRRSRGSPEQPTRAPPPNPGRWRAARNDLNRQLRPCGLLGVDATHGAQARITGQGVAGDQAAAVVADHGDVVQLQQVEDAPDASDVLVDA